MCVYKNLLTVGGVKAVSPNYKKYQRKLENLTEIQLLNTSLYDACKNEAKKI